jgi:hypothetical protein
VPEKWLWKVADTPEWLTQGRDTGQERNRDSGFYARV